MYYLKIYDNDSINILSFNSRNKMIKTKNFFSNAKNVLIKEVTEYQYQHFIKRKGQ